LRDYLQSNSCCSTDGTIEGGVVSGGVNSGSVNVGVSGGGEVRMQTSPFWD
jgi:hypothetical protein